MFTARPNLNACQVTLIIAGLLGAAGVALASSSTNANNCHRDRGDALQPPLDGDIDAEFGMQKHPILSTYRLHPGVDYRRPLGTEIKASAAGVVTFAGRNGEYGNAILVAHSDNTTTRYSQLAKILIAEGQCISRAQVIGLLGSTGLSSEPHLHFETLLGDEPVNPRLIFTVKERQL